MESHGDKKAAKHLGTVTKIEEQVKKKGPEPIWAENNRLKEGRQSFVLIEELEATVTELWNSSAEFFMNRDKREEKYL